MILEKHKHTYDKNGEPQYIGFHFDSRGDEDIDNYNKKILYEYVKIGLLKKEFYDLIADSIYSHKGSLWLETENSLPANNWFGQPTEYILEDIILNQSKYASKILLDKSKGLDNSRRIITSDERYTILREQKWSCNICGKKLKFNKNSPFGEEVAHIDHIHPFSKRLTYAFGFERINERSNLQALCATCNLNKSEKEIN